MERNYVEEAVEKIKNGKDEKLNGGYKVVADAVRDVLCEFCQQDEEFAQAVVQGKSVAACVNEVLKGHGSCISDIDVYRRVVDFYFPGATVEVTMRVKVNPYEEDKTASSVIELDLDDLI